WAVLELQDRGWRIAPHNPQASLGHAVLDDIPDLIGEPQHSIDIRAMVKPGDEYDLRIPLHRGSLSQRHNDWDQETLGCNSLAPQDLIFLGCYHYDSFS